MQTYANLVHQRQLPSFPQNPFTVAVAIAPAPKFALPFGWELMPQYEAAPAQVAPGQDGMSLGTFLALVVTGIGGVVLFNPNSSEEWKALAKIGLGVSVPHLLGKAFDLQSWPGQLN